MKKVSAIALMIISILMMGQAVAPLLTRSEVVMQVDTFSTANASLYVATTGSNANDCASALTPCATLTGAIAKMPWVKRHIFTINVAAGTYTENPVIDGIIENGGGIDIVGPTMSAVSDAGVFTAVSNTAPATFTDSTKTFTTDQWAGSFLVVTAGTGSGGIAPIIANTATVITTGPTFTTGPDTASTYEIRRPAAIITSSTAASSTLFVKVAGVSPFYNSTTGAGRIRITGLGFENSGAQSVACRTETGGTQIDLVNTRCWCSNGTGQIHGGGPLRTNEFIAYGAGTVRNGLVLGSSASASGSPASSWSNLPWGASLNRSNFFGGAGVASAILLQAGGKWTVGTRGIALRATAGSSAGVLDVRANIETTGGISASTLMIYCDATTAPGLNLGSSATSTGGTSVFAVSSLYVSGCGIGISAGNPRVVMNVVGNTTLNNILTTGVSALNGAFVRTGTITLTGTTPTNEVLIDALTLTAAQLDANVPKISTNPTFGTTVSIQ